MAINQFTAPADFIRGMRDLRWNASESISMPDVTIKNPDQNLIPLINIELNYADLHDTALSINNADLFFSDLSRTKIISVTNPNIQYTCVNDADFSRSIVTPNDINFWYCQEGQSPKINNSLALAKVIVLSEEEFATFPQLKTSQESLTRLYQLLQTRGSQ